MNVIVILGIFIFLFYIYYNPKNLESFSVGSVAINSDDIYKENHDLNYIENRTKMDISSEDNVRTQRMAPMNNPSNGRDAYPETVDAQDFLPSGRVPDEISDRHNYRIPMPKFDDIQKFNDISIKKKNKKKPEKKIEKRVLRGTNTKQCKFISSKANSKITCPKDYPIFTGATFGIQGRNVSCNGKKIKSKRAHAVASIKNGQVTKINITERGTHYDLAPKIKIVGGGGKYASAYALVKKGKLSKIIITNTGSGYKSTPKIKIAEPNAIINCNLCCKNEL